MINVDESDRKVIDALSTLKLPAMDKVIRDRFPAEVFESGAIDIEAMKKTHDELGASSVKYFGYTLILICLLFFDYLNTGVKISLFGLSIENSEGVKGFLLIAIAICIAIDYGYTLRRKYFESIIRTYIIKHEPLNRWITMHEEVLAGKLPFFSTFDVEFFSQPDKRKWSDLRLQELMMRATCIPLIVSYFLISLISVYEVWTAESYGVLGKLVATVPFLIVNTLLILQPILVEDYIELSEPRIQRELEATLVSQGRPAFEAKCAVVASAVSRSRMSF